MLPPFKFNKRTTVVAAGLILAVGFLAYYFFNSFYGVKNDPILPRDTEVTGQDGKIKILPDTDFVQRIVYLKCGDEEVLKSKPPENLVGLNYYQVQNSYPGWNIDKFDTLAVEMTLKVDSYCREHANNMFIGVKDGYVAVFYGKPGEKPILKEVTKIAVGKLNQQDAEELRRGVVIHSKEELLRTLEGMQSR
jgi:hypothetical protein